jgi:hypothetical protein
MLWEAYGQGFDGFLSVIFFDIGLFEPKKER